MRAHDKLAGGTPAPAADPVLDGRLAGACCRFVLPFSLLVCDLLSIVGFCAGAVAWSGDFCAFEGSRLGGAP